MIYYHLLDIAGDEATAEPDEAHSPTDNDADNLYPPTGLSSINNGWDGRDMGRIGFIDMQAIERVAGMYAAAKSGGVDSMGGGPAPSLSLDTDLPSELKAIFLSLQKVTLVVYVN